VAKHNAGGASMARFHSEPNFLEGKIQPGLFLLFVCHLGPGASSFKVQRSTTELKSNVPLASRNVVRYTKVKCYPKMEKRKISVDFVVIYANYRSFK
jgi:hypothetical protein